MIMVQGGGQVKERGEVRKVRVITVCMCREQCALHYTENGKGNF
jgi:hypothetical protein